MNALTVVSLVAAFAVANAGEPILRGPSGIITANGPIGPEGLGLGGGLGARPILRGPSGIITSAGPIGPSEMGGLRGGLDGRGILGGIDDGLDGRGILKGPSGIITSRGPIGPSGEMAGRGGNEAGAILLDGRLDGRLGLGGGVNLIAPRVVASRLIAPAMLDGRLGGLGLDGRVGLADGRLGLIDRRLGLANGRLGLADGRLGLIDGRLGLADGRLGLRGLEGSGLEGQYVPDLTEKLYDDGSYRPDLRGH